MVSSFTQSNAGTNNEKSAKTSPMKVNESILKLLRNDDDLSALFNSHPSRREDFKKMVEVATKYGIFDESNTPQPSPKEPGLAAFQENKSEWDKKCNFYFAVLEGNHRLIAALYTFFMSIAKKEFKLGEKELTSAYLANKHNAGCFYDYNKPDGYDAMKEVERKVKNKERCVLTGSAIVNIYAAKATMPYETTALEFTQKFIRPISAKISSDRNNTSKPGVNSQCLQIRQVLEKYAGSKIQTGAALRHLKIDKNMSLSEEFIDGTGTGHPSGSSIGVKDIEYLNHENVNTYLKDPIQNLESFLSTARMVVDGGENEKSDLHPMPPILTVKNMASMNGKQLDTNQLSTLVLFPLFYEVTSKLVSETYYEENAMGVKYLLATINRSKNSVNIILTNNDEKEWKDDGVAVRLQKDEKAIGGNNEYSKVVCSALLLTHMYQAAQIGGDESLFWDGLDAISELIQYEYTDQETLDYLCKLAGIHKYIRNSVPVLYASNIPFQLQLCFTKTQRKYCWTT